MAYPAMTPIVLRIQELREAEGWSQSELARRSGVPQTAISRLEAGKVGVVNLAHLEKLAAVFGVKPAYLIGEVSEKGKRGR
jgi:HTH-type transcriptional regulator / antitoxin HipB